MRRELSLQCMTLDLEQKKKHGVSDVYAKNISY